jgi:VIT1/CCC1 family predicted Fe2+/Mn2+ transporter
MAPSQRLGLSEEPTWEESRMHVFQTLSDSKETLERIGHDIESLRKQQTSIAIRMAFYAGIFAFIGAAVPLAIDVAMRWHEVVSR